MVAQANLHPIAGLGRAHQIAGDENIRPAGPVGAHKAIAGLSGHKKALHHIGTLGLPVAFVTFGAGAVKLVFGLLFGILFPHISSTPFGVANQVLLAANASSISCLMGSFSSIACASASRGLILGCAGKNTVQQSS